MTAPVQLSMIVARSRNGVIGVDGDLPWRLSDDLAFSKQTTKGHPIVMGRKTWLSLPRRPLPGRANIVLTRDHTFLAPGARTCSTLKSSVAVAKAIASVESKQEVFIVGGAAVYTAAMPLADRLYLTEVDVELEGDVSFPAFDETEFEEVESHQHRADERNQYDFKVRVLQRRNTD